MDGLQMKGLVLEDYHRFVYWDVPMPACGPEDVLVGVKACGICGSDVHGMGGSTGRRIPPLIMGHEAAGAMFIAGMSPILEPPLNDVWTVPGEEHLLEQWRVEDRATFDAIDATRHYHLLQDQDFLQAILEDRAPMVSGEEGRKTVELFTAIYRSQRDGRPVRFPMAAEDPVD